MKARHSACGAIASWRERGGGGGCILSWTETGRMLDTVSTPATGRSPGPVVWGSAPGHHPVVGWLARCYLSSATPICCNDTDMTSDSPPSAAAAHSKACYILASGIPAWCLRSATSSSA